MQLFDYTAKPNATLSNHRNTCKQTGKTTQQYQTNFKIPIVNISYLQNVSVEEDPFVPTCGDLAGFWDMVHIQVEQIHRRFDALIDLKKADWIVKVKKYLYLVY